jgi:hypothetical protein
MTARGLGEHKREWHAARLPRCVSDSPKIKVVRPDAIAQERWTGDRAGWPPMTDGAKGNVTALESVGAVVERLRARNAEIVRALYDDIREAVADTEATPRGSRRRTPRARTGHDQKHAARSVIDAPDVALRHSPRSRTIR